LVCMFSLQRRPILWTTGGGFELFPEKPPRMHIRTYERLRRVYEIARDRSIQGVLGRVPRVERDLR
jgi:hypothetical protein